MDKLRPCIVNSALGNKRALFHRFADDVSYTDDRQVPFTSAIVEFEDGQLKKVDPNLIKFDIPALKSD